MCVSLSLFPLYSSALSYLWYTTPVHCHLRILSVTQHGDWRLFTAGRLYRADDISVSRSKFLKPRRPPVVVVGPNVLVQVGLFTEITSQLTDSKVRAD